MGTYFSSIKDRTCNIIGFGTQSVEKEVLWNEWLNTLSESPSHVLLLHGILGGELYDNDISGIVWLHLKALWDPNLLQFDASNDKTIAKDVVYIPFVGRFYQQVILNDNLRASPFAWDWRDSAMSGALELQRFLKNKVNNNSKLVDEGINIVAHSFGACVIMTLLDMTYEFDDLFKSIILIGPAFGGALNSLQVLELGNGTTPTVDFLVNSENIRKTVATYPSTFDNLIAPAHLWVDELPLNEDGKSIKLRYPFPADSNPWQPGHLTNPYHTERRGPMIQEAREYHERVYNARTKSVERLKDKIFVIVGLNGKSQFAAQKLYQKKEIDPSYIIHSFQGSPNGDSNALFNGDGAVLFQSSFIPAIDPSHHLALIPNVGTYTHTSLVDNPLVLKAIELIVNRHNNEEFSMKYVSENSGLVGYYGFINRIDFSKEEESSDFKLEYYKHIDYMMRWRLRASRSSDEWKQLNLDPIDQRHLNVEDHILFEKVEKAAERVISGEPVSLVASQVGLDQLYIIHHALRLVAPQLSSCTLPILSRVPTEKLARQGSWKDD